MKKLEIEGYELRGDLYYDSVADMWVAVDQGRAKVGFDPLGLEVNGTLAQLALAKVGSATSRGESMGTLEAEKFVGPIVAPLSGSVAAINDDALLNVSKLHTAPYDTWILEIEMSDLGELDLLVTGADLENSFAQRLEAYRKKGVLAR